MMVQKLIAVLLVAVLGMGHVGCLCAAMLAADPPDACASHSAAEPEGEPDNACCAVACLDACDQVKRIALDDSAIVPASNLLDINPGDSSEPLAWTFLRYRPPDRVAMPGATTPLTPVDTPVDRFDRLLN